MKNVIDISKYNETIDFEKVKQSGINDVIISVGWIGNHENHTLDKRFNEYFRQAKLYGFNVGVYVYSYCKTNDTLKSGMEWLKNILINKTLELPVFLDLEDKTIESVGKENLTKQAIEFCEYFKSLGYVSGIYANKNWFTNYLDHRRLVDYKIWWAEYNGKDKPTNNYKIDLWQYTSKGFVVGINTNVDISLCMCDCEEKTIENKRINNGDDIEVKRYVNGSTSENVYSDTNLSNKIGSLNPRETCECLGIYQGRAIVRYKVDNKQNYKIGFVKWLGGIQ